MQLGAQMLEPTALPILEACQTAIQVLGKCRRRKDAWALRPLVVYESRAIKHCCTVAFLLGQPKMIDLG